MNFSSSFKLYNALAEDSVFIYLSTYQV